jgi:hypothetical protein
VRGGIVWRAQRSPEGARVKASYSQFGVIEGMPEWLPAIQIIACVAILIALTVW